MSIRRSKTISLKDNHTNIQAIPYLGAPPTPLPPVSWTRNPSWLTLPSVTNSEEKIVGLYQILDGANYIAFTVEGNYIVDWGDGSAPENISSGMTASHQYDYSNVNLNGTNAPVTFDASTGTVNRNSHGYNNNDQISFASIVTTSGIVATQTYYVINATTNTFQLSSTKNGSPITLTNNGTGTILPYKQAIVIIVPQLGSNLTVLNLDVKYVNTPALNAYAAGWMDMKISMPQLSSSGLVIGSSNNIYKTLLEQINLVNLGNLTSANNLFDSCYALGSVIFPDTCHVTNMSYMFKNCYSLSSIQFPTNSLLTVTDMYYMFSGCASLQQAILPNTSSVNSMDNMFSSCSMLNSVTFTDLSGVSSAGYMFNNCINLITCTLPGMPLLTSADNMFRYCYSLTSVTIPDLSSVVSMYGTFNSCSKLRELNFPALPSLLYVNDMFEYCYFEQAPYFDTSNVTSMYSMFYRCDSLKTVPPYNTQNVEDMSYMFSDCHSLETVPLFNTAKVTDFSGMFRYCYSLKSVPLFDMSSAYYTSNMFNGCPSLITIPDFNLSSVYDANSMFYECYGLKSVTFTNSPGQYIDYMFESCYTLEKVILLDMSTVISCSYLFYYCNLLQVVELPDTIPNVTDISNMFGYCNYLYEITLPNLPAVTNVYNMLIGSSIESVTFQNIDSLTSLSYAVANSNLKELNIPDTSNITNMSYMFSNCSFISAPYMNTSSVTNMIGMFYNCRSLKNVPLYDTSNVTKFNKMFGGCVSLQTVPTFDTSNGTSFVDMFYGAGGYYYSNTPNYSLTTVPRFNLQNAIVNYDYYYDSGGLSSTGLLNMVYNANSLTSFLPYNIRISINFSNCKLSKNALATIFDNLAVPYNPSDKTITITNNPDVDTPVVKNIGTPLTNIYYSGTYFYWQNSKPFKYINTSFYMYAYDYSDPNLANKFYVSGGVSNMVTYGVLNNNDLVVFTSDYPGITKNTVYYVVNKTTYTFQISLSPDGSPIQLQGTQSVGSGQVIIQNPYRYIYTYSFSMYIYNYSDPNYANKFYISGGTNSFLKGGILLEGDQLVFHDQNSYTTGINNNTVYYVINKTDYTFQLSLSPGGVPINLQYTGTMYRDNVYIAGQTIKFSGVASNSGFQDNTPYYIIRNYGYDYPQYFWISNSLTGNTYISANNYGTINVVDPQAGAITTAGSNTVPMTDTSSLANGMLVTGSGMAISSPYGPSAAVDVSTDTFTCNNHGLSDGMIIAFPNGGGTISNIIANTIYYVINSATNTFQISTTLGGSVMDLTGSNDNVVISYPSYIASINTNVSITLTTPAGSSASLTSLTFRILDTAKAVMKGWNITT